MLSPGRFEIERDRHPRDPRAREEFSSILISVSCRKLSRERPTSSNGRKSETTARSYRLVYCTRSSENARSLSRAEPRALRAPHIKIARKHLVTCPRAIFLPPSLSLSLSLSFPRFFAGDPDS